MSLTSATPSLRNQSPRRLTYHPLIRALFICGAAISLLSSLPTAHAADGDLDSTFADDGRVLTDFNRSTDIANAVAVDADGKYVVVGTTYINNDYSGEDFAIARFNANGTLDSTF